MNLSENQQDHILLLQDIARRAMLQRGLLPDFPSAVQAEAENILAPQNPAANETIRDLRTLLWASIDNDDSMDLDQLTVAEALDHQGTRIRVAVADVDSLVPFGSAIDEHASHNTTSIYMAAEIFPMLPVKLSNDFTSLNPDVDRLAVVTDMVIGTDGHIKESDVYRAVVRNHAKLAYNSVAAWLDEEGPEPEAVTAVPGLAENIRLQQTVSETLDKFRQEQGALNFQTIEGKAVFEGNQIVGLKTEQRNCAKLIIEVFMISANTTNAKFLEGRKFPSIRRVVRKPKRCDRIVAVAKEYNFVLPPYPNAKALNEFLLLQKEADPLCFPDHSRADFGQCGTGVHRFRQTEAGETVVLRLF